MLGSLITHCSSRDGRGPNAKPAGAIVGKTATDTEKQLRKVLIVDDESDLADLAAALLSARGLEVLVAYSGHEAVEKLAANYDIDAVVTDIVMPGMTGFELADAIRQMYPRIKIVLASGFTPPDQLMNRGRAYLFASKPYRIDTILKLLHT